MKMEYYRVSFLCHDLYKFDQVDDVSSPSRHATPLLYLHIIKNSTFVAQISHYLQKTYFGSSNIFRIHDFEKFKSYLMTVCLLEDTLNVVIAESQFHPLKYASNQKFTMLKGLCTNCVRSTTDIVRFRP